MVKTHIYYDLRDALARPGCPICRLTHDASERFIDGLIYEKVNNPRLRAAIRAARGFCRDHAWALDRHGASLGVAIMLRGVLSDVADELRADLARDDEASTRMPWRALAPGPSTRAEVARALSTRTECPVCAAVRDWEQAAYEALYAHLPDLRPALSASSGLCLTHLTRALDRAPDPVARRDLVKEQLPILERLLADLEALVRKSDYRFHDELSEQEAAAWLRGIAALSGERQASMRERFQGLGGE